MVEAVEEVKEIHLFDGGKKVPLYTETYTDAKFSDVYKMDERKIQLL